MKSDQKIGLWLVGAWLITAPFAAAQEHVAPITSASLTQGGDVDNGAVAAVLGDEFTYQGYIEDAGGAIHNQALQMEFQAYNAGGTALAAAVSKTVPAADVYKGVFKVDLDAAAAALPDNAEETVLDVRVCKGLSCTLETLAPRVKITRSVYAVSTKSVGGVAYAEPDGSFTVQSSAAG